jgi:hypothetical protein
MRITKSAPAKLILWTPMGTGKWQFGMMLCLISIEQTLNDRAHFFGIMAATRRATAALPGGEKMP